MTLKKHNVYVQPLQTVSENVNIFKMLTYMNIKGHIEAKAAKLPSFQSLKRVRHKLVSSVNVSHSNVI